MEILLWLLPAVVVTTATAAWLVWRDHRQAQPLTDEQRAAALERMGEAIVHPAPLPHRGGLGDQRPSGVRVPGQLDTERSA